MADTISLARARRIALAAQGFADRRPDGECNQRHLKRVLKHTRLLQIDSVGAVVRAHYMPAFSRLGPYRMSMIDEATSKRPRRMFEYWAHEASLLPIETWPLVQWRMARAADGHGIYSGLAKFGREKREFIERVFAEVDARGPLAASDFDGHQGTGGWWGWSEVKHALEWLFWAGRVTTHSRKPSFERLYDLPERVLPKAILAEPVPSPADAQRRLVELSARALGIATASDLRDYFRLAPADCYPRIEELVEEGALLPVTVKGWPRQAYLHRDARMPRKVGGRALLAPFDPLVWERSRAERLFGFRYRIEIYTPAHKRTHGYYVLPFRLGEAIVARIDVKSDRAGNVLRVVAAYSEPNAPDDTAAELAQELHLMAAWLGLDRVSVEPAGDLAPALAAAVEGAN